MPILNHGSGPFPHLARLACKLSALAEDLQQIARGEHPTERALREAPILMDWRVSLSPMPHLVGTVVGHPEIADGRICRTSELVTFDPVSGYARTFSRFYRLGPWTAERDRSREGRAPRTAEPLRGDVRRSRASGPPRVGRRFGTSPDRRRTGPPGSCVRRQRRTGQATIRKGHTGRPRSCGTDVGSLRGVRVRSGQLGGRGSSAGRIAARCEGQPRSSAVSSESNLRPRNRGLQVRGLADGVLPARPIRSRQSRPFEKIYILPHAHDRMIKGLSIRRERPIDAFPCPQNREISVRPHCPS